MLRLRLQRRGKRGYASYRVVVAERGASVKGRSIDDVGFYNPHTDEFKVNAEKVRDWITKGAKPSSTVHNLLVEEKIIKGKKVTSWRPKKKKPEDKAEEARQEKVEEAVVIEKEDAGDNKDGGKEPTKKKAGEKKEKA